MQGLLETIAPCPFTIFKKKFCYETFRGKRNPECFFLENLSDFFSRKSEFFPENTIFFSRIVFLFENIRNSGFRPCIYTTFRKHTESDVWSLSEFPCFIVCGTVKCVNSAKCVNAAKCVKINVSTPLNVSNQR